MNQKVSTSNPATQENDAVVRITNRAEVRKIIGHYLGKFDVEVRFNRIVSHPVCSDNMWKSEIGFSDDTAIPKILSNPTELQKVNDMAKAAIGKYVREQPLTDIFRSLHTPYSFKILQSAEKYLATDEFSRLLRATWETSLFYFKDSDVFTREELVDLLNSCDPQSFMTSNELEWYNHHTPFVEDIYRGEDDCDADTFVWTDNPAGAIVDERFGIVGCYNGYSASINREDIFAYIENYYGGYIVNPNKLWNVESVPDLRDYCERDELDEDDWEDYDDGYDDEDWDED